MSDLIFSRLSFELEFEHPLAGDRRDRVFAGVGADQDSRVLAANDTAIGHARDPQMSQTRQLKRSKSHTVPLF